MDEHCASACFEPGHPRVQATLSRWEWECLQRQARRQMGVLAAAGTQANGGACSGRRASKRVHHGEQWGHPRRKAPKNVVP